MTGNLRTSRVPRPLGADCWQLNDAKVEVTRVAPSVLVYRFSGKMVPELVPKIRSVADSALRTESEISLYFDTEEMTGYHPEFRSQMTDWHEELTQVTRMAGVLVRSRVIKMAISVASLVTGGKLESFSNRLAFEGAIDAAVRSSTLTSARAS